MSRIRKAHPSSRTGTTYMLVVQLIGEMLGRSVSPKTKPILDFFDNALVHPEDQQPFMTIFILVLGLLYYDARAFGTVGEQPPYKGKAMGRDYSQSYWMSTVLELLKDTGLESSVYSQEVAWLRTILHASAVAVCINCLASPSKEERRVARLSWGPHAIAAVKWALRFRAMTVAPATDAVANDNWEPSPVAERVAQGIRAMTKFEKRALEYSVEELEARLAMVEVLIKIFEVVLDESPPPAGQTSRWQRRLFVMAEARIDKVTRNLNRTFFDELPEHAVEELKARARKLGILIDMLEVASKSAPATDILGLL
jgi:hypothetical protein